MVFTTLNGELALFGKSLRNIKRDLGNGQGFFTSVFGGNRLTSNDIQCIKNYNAAVNSGMNATQAWNATMKGASVAGKQMCVDVQKGNVTMEELTQKILRAKAAQIGLRAATVALNIAFMTLASIAVNAIYKGIDNLIHAAENAQKAAEEAALASKQEAEASKSNLDSLDEQIDKYQELMQKKSEGIDVNNDLLQLQSDINDLIGKQAENVDVVNGNYQEQLELLYEIRNVKLGDTLTDFAQAYKDAEKAAEGYTAHSGAWVYDLTAGNNVITIDVDAEGHRQEAMDIINKVWKEKGYGSADLYTQTYDLIGLISDTFEKLTFDDSLDLFGKIEALDAAIDALKNDASFDYTGTELYSKLVEIRRDLGGSDGLVTKMVESANSYLKILTEQTVAGGKNLASYDDYLEYREQIISQLSDDTYIKSAIASGAVSADMIERQVDSYFSTLSKYKDFYSEWYDSIHGSQESGENNVFTESFEKLLGSQSFTDTIDDYLEKISSLQTALENMSSEDFSNQDLVELLMEFPELADNVDTLDEAIQTLMGDLRDDMSGYLDEIFDTMASEEDIGKLRNLVDAILSVGFDGKSVGILEVVQSNISLINNALTESASATGLTTESVEGLVKAYSDLADFDASKLFQQTSNGIKVNRKELTRLNREYNNKNLKQYQDMLDLLKVGYMEEYDAALKAGIGTAEYNAALLRMNGIREQIQEVETLITEYDGLTSAYNEYLAAQSSSDDRDMYAKIGEDYEKVRDLLDQGWSGMDDVTSYLDVLLGSDWEKRFSDAYDAFDSLTQEIGDTGNSIRDFFQYDDNGNLLSDGLYTFLDTVHEVFGDEYVKKFADGSYEFDFGDPGTEKFDALIEKIGLSEEAVRMLEYALKDAGFDVQIGSSSLDQLPILGESVSEAVSSLRDLGYLTDVEIDLNADPDGLQQQLDAATSLLDSWRDDNGEIKTEFQEDGYPELVTLIMSLITKKQTLERPAIMSIDTTDAEGDVMSLISLFQQYIELTNTKEALLSVNSSADTSSIDAAIGDVLTQISTIPDEAKVKVVGSEEGLTELQTAIDTLTGEDKDITVTANTEEGSAAITAITDQIAAIEPKDIGINTPTADDVESELEYINNYTINNKSFTITSTDKASSTINHILGLLASVKSKTVTITTVYKTQSSGSGGAQGTAHLRGTAYKAGDWGTKGSGVALMGEMGPEMVVHNGKWFLAGENSAEFVPYRRGDIIFNAEQTRQLLQNGKIQNGAKRGISYLEGTAFDSGSGGGRRYTSTYTITSNSGGSGGGSSSSSSTSSSNDAVDDFEETFDWIEMAIDRIERDISQLDTKAQSVYRSWSERNANLKDEIDAVGEEILIQQAGYERYLKEANSVGLAESWAKLVREGAIDISTIKDEAMADKIKAYQEWYEKALDCRDAIDELRETEAELYKQRFENAEKQADGILEAIEFQKSMIEESITQTETKGYLVSSQYYEALIKNEQNTITELTKKRKDLIAALNEAVSSGKIEEGTEAWQEMCNTINSVTLEIKKADTATLEYSNHIREAEWGVFDLLQKRISYITDESNFLISLMENHKLFTDNGQFTEYGTATMGLRGVNYNTYMEQAIKYGEEIRRLNRQIANDPYDQTLIDRRDELLEKQRDSILAAENEKKAIVDLVKEGIEKELDALKDLIDTYTDALDSQKDLYDYQKKVSEQTKEIATLQKQLSAYEGDMSEENRARLQKLGVALAEAQEELQETEYERYISDQKKLLDDLYNDYETILNMRLDDVDALISDMISTANTNASDIMTTIENAAGSVGLAISSAMSTIWSAGFNGSSLDTYLNGATTYQTGVQTAIGLIETDIAAMVSDLNAMATEESKEAEQSDVSQNNKAPATNQPSSALPTETTPAPAPASAPAPAPEPEPAKSSPPSLYKGAYVQVKAGHRWHEASDGTGKTGYSGYDRWVTIKSINNASWAKYPYLVDNLGWVSASDIVGYAKGIRRVSADGMAWTQEDGKEFILRPSDGAVLTPLAKNDSVFTAAASQNLWNAANDPGQFVRDAIGHTGVSIPVGGGSTVIDGNYEFNINLPNVQNYEQFKYEMQHDSSFERMIRSMTVDRMFGKSSLRKYKS